MSLLSMKINEEEMEQMLSGLLTFPDETVEAGIYCSYQDTGFFASPYHVTMGYLGLTSRSRLIGVRAGMIASEQINIDLSCVTKIKIRKGLLGQRTVYLEYFAGRKSALKFTVVPRAGKKLPQQKENYEILMGELEGRAYQLKG